MKMTQMFVLDVIKVLLILVLLMKNKNKSNYLNIKFMLTNLSIKSRKRAIN